jgi:hypothetical protein
MPAKDISITANYRDPSAKTFKLTVVNGTGSGSFESGAVVEIQADDAPSGKVFNTWTGAAVADAKAASTSITMPSAETTVTATYRDAGATLYSLTVVNGIGSGDYQAGESVQISAKSAASVWLFTEWSGDVGGVADASSADTTLVMPAAAATVTANFSRVEWKPSVAFSSTHAEASKGSKDAYTVTATFTVAKGFATTPLSLLSEDSYVSIDIGGFSFGDVISNGKTKITTKLGSAVFLTDANDTVTFKWDAKKVTVSVKSKLPIDETANILDMSIYDAGKASDTLDECAMSFGGAVWTGGIPWSGTVKVDAKKGFLSWTAKGKATQ